MPDESTLTEPLPDNYLLRFNPEQAELVSRFLATCLTKAEYALEKCTPDDRDLLSHPMIRRQMDYWRNVASGIKWCGHLASLRQIHLGIDHDPQIEEILRQWTKQLPILSEAVQLGSYVCFTAGSQVVILIGE